MRAEHHELLRSLGAAQTSDHVPNPPPRVVVENDADSHGRARASGPVGHRQTAVPRCRDRRATALGQQPLGIRVPQCHDRHLRQAVCGRRSRSRDRGRPPRRGRVPGRSDLDRAALHPVRRPEGAVRVDRATNESVVRRIRVQDDRSRAGIFGVANLVTPEDLTVADERDPAGDVDTGIAERGEVGRATVVRVHHRCGDVTGGGVAGRHRVAPVAVLAMARRIGRHGHRPRRATELCHADLHGVGKPHVVFGDLDLEAPGRHQRLDDSGGAARSCRPRHARRVSQGSYDASELVTAHGVGHGSRNRGRSGGRLSRPRNGRQHDQSERAADQQSTAGTPERVGLPRHDSVRIGSSPTYRQSRLAAPDRCGQSNR